MPSIIIPAHNEESVIERTLRAVLADEIPDLEIVVVVNATTDRTAEIARDLDSRITVIETSTPGKTNALNLGEKTMKAFPRVFLDADITFKPGTLAAILTASSDLHPIVSPQPVYDLSGCSIAMRLYMQAENYNHYYGRGAPNGSGCFVLSAEGRSRWGEFPQVIADDGYVQNQFHPHESMTVSSAHATVLPPRDLNSMITVRARVRRGQFELGNRFPEIMGKNQSQVGGVLTRMLLRPWTWAALSIYCWVRIRERQLARRQIAAGETGWGRDDSGRQAN
ncbi:MAG: glycosyltransferase family A protein [Planctomycetota bacterium]|nr:glycosyltransferase family A protein [Planctomycetota bacterium]